MSERSQPPKGGAAFAGVALATAAFLGLLHKWEGQETTVYADKLAGGLPTVCSGITRHVTTTPIIVGEKWSKEKCATHEAAITDVIQRNLRQCFTTTPPQSVFDAASSLAWNVGFPSVCRSQSMRLWNARDWGTGCLRIAYTPNYQPNWSNASGRFVQGLFNRRVDEVKVCVSGLRGAAT